MEKCQSKMEKWFCRLELYLRQWFLLLCQRIWVCAHSICSCPNGIVIAVRVFSSSLMVLNLFSMVLFLRQRNRVYSRWLWVCADWFCFFANGIVSLPIDFVSALRGIVSGPAVFHSLNSSKPRRPRLSCVIIMLSMTGRLQRKSL